VDLVQLSGVSLLHTSLVLHASHPSVVELVGAIAHDVVATLDGPVTLRVTDSVSSVDFRVVADGSATGASFEARHSDFTNLWTGTPKAPFPGTVRIDETRLAQSQIEAEQVRLESSTLVVSRLGAARLDGIDVNIRNSEFSLGGGLLSAVTLDTCEVTGCGELTLVAGQVFDTRIAPCSDGPLRAYSTTFETAEVAGNIESDDSGWHRTVFGAQLAGPMVFWGGGGKNSTFCEDVSSVVFDDNAEWACTACPDGFAREDAVCVLPDTLPYSATEDNPCVSFVTPPECSPPFPENVRRAGPFFK